MIKNYLKVAWRSIFKNKVFSIINILGLALGMSCSLLIILWVRDEINIDAFHANEIYSAYERQYHDGVVDAHYATPGMLGEEMKHVLPEVQYASNFAWRTTNTFEFQGKVLKQEGNYAGEDFFTMFSFPLLAGRAETALKSTVDIAISRKMAEEFYGSIDNAIGKPLRYNNRKDLQVTAVFENITLQSSLKFDYIINWQTFLEDNSWAKEWGNNGPGTYFILREGSDVAAFDKKFIHFIERYNKEENFRIELDKQKLSERYLHSNFKAGELEGGRIQYVTLFSIVAVFILLIACINFMNLTTARSVKRAKEIGIRKVVGAVRSSLIRQFISEGMMIVFFSFMLALLLVAIGLPWFNEVTRKQISLPLNDIYFWTTLIILTLITGFVSGSYPSLYLSSFNPAKVLKGSLKFSLGALWFRKGLVVFQFVLSIMLIIGTIVITRQVDYIQSTNVGYDRENVIFMPLEGEFPSKYKLFKDQALKLPGVKTITRISQNPVSVDNGTGGVQWEGKVPGTMIQFTQMAIGFDFSRVMNATIIAGRDFAEEFPSDSVGYIVNETAAKIFNYKDPVGMPLTFWEKKGTIVGVMKDFHFNSLHVPIKPLVLRMGENLGWGGAMIKAEAGQTKEVLSGLEKLSKELNPQFPFTYEFLDEEYHQMYTAEETVSKLSNGFAFLAIFISCLGLLGLTMFTAEQRTKEIGIRKVLGASLLSLFNLLSKELLVLVTLSMAIAAPLAWMAMDKWLQEFAYRIEIGWWIFVAAGLLAILIALATISFQTIKALVANPVTSVRSE